MHPAIVEDLHQRLKTGPSHQMHLQPKFRLQSPDALADKVFGVEHVVRASALSWGNTRRTHARPPNWSGPFHGGIRSSHGLVHVAARCKPSAKPV